MAIPNEIWSALIGAGTTLLVILVRWWLSLPAKQRAEERAAQRHLLEQSQAEVKQVQAIEESNTKMAIQLRDEMREYTVELRNRVRDTEKMLAATVARLDDVRTDNERLRKENLDLKGENGALKAKTEAQEKRIALQEDRIAALERDNEDQRSDRLALVDAMRTGGLPIPPLKSDRRSAAGRSILDGAPGTPPSSAPAPA